MFTLFSFWSQRIPYLQWPLLGCYLIVTVASLPLLACQSKSPPGSNVTINTSTDLASTHFIKAFSKLKGSQEALVLLQAKPTLFKANGQPQATAGLIPYVAYEGQVYVLLGRQAWVDKHNYSELSGKVEKPHNHLESFLTAALREGLEETCGVYALTKDSILKHYYLYFENTPKRQVALIFVPVTYMAGSVLKEKVLYNKKPECTEKNEFQWLNVKDLLAIAGKPPGSYPIDSFQRGKQSLKLRKYFKVMLKEPAFQEILKALCLEAENYEASIEQAA